MFFFLDKKERKNQESPMVIRTWPLGRRGLSGSRAATNKNTSKQKN
jgi:hypothetical protein